MGSLQLLLFDKTQKSQVTGVNVKAQRRPIFDKAEDLDKHARYQRDVLAGRGKMQRVIKMPNITYDHAKKTVLKQLYTINATV